MALIQDSGRGYIAGFTTLALAMFIGYKWNGGYLTFVSNGYNFLYLFWFGVTIFIMTWLVDKYYKRRKKNES